MARSKSQDTEVQDTEVQDTEAAQSWSTAATLLDTSTYPETIVTALPSPTFRGKGNDANARFQDAAKTMAEFFTYVRAEVHQEMRYVRMYVTDTLAIHVMVKRSGSQCPQCGHVRTEDGLSDWCHCDVEIDKDGNRAGCGYWRGQPEVSKGKRSSINAARAADLF